MASSSKQCPHALEHLERITRLETVVEGVREDTAETRTMVTRLDGWLRGDNGEGVIPRVKSLEESRDKQDRQRRSRRRWAGGILAAAIIAVISAAIGLAAK